MMEIITHTVKSQTLFSILSLNTTTLELFMLKLFGLMQNSINRAFSPTSREIFLETDLNTSRNNEFKDIRTKFF